MKFWPSPSQWRNWTLPSKLTAIGAYVGIAGLAVTLIGFGSSLKRDEPSRVGAIIALTSQRVAYEPSTNKVAVVLTFINSGDRPTTADVDSKLLIDNKPAMIENVIPKRQDFSPKQPTLMTFWLLFSPDGYKALWDGRVRLRAEFTIDYLRQLDEHMRYTFVGQLNPDTRQIDTLTNETVSRPR